jgi:molecular chaperone GrpE
MSEQNVNDASTAGDQPEDTLSIDDANDIASMAISSQLEVPSGAEDIVEALAMITRQRDEHLEALQRTAADLQNLHRRARIQAQEAREQSVRGVVSSLLMSLDTFDLALNQDPEKVSVAQLFEGVRAIKSEVLRQLSSHGVAAIEPAPGEPFEPGRHEAVMYEPTDEVEPGTVARTLQTGYAMGEGVIRPAKVAVAATPQGDTEETADADV